MPAVADPGQDTSGSWLAIKPHLILPCLAPPLPGGRVGTL
jgi:hypothetical protein